MGTVSNTVVEFLNEHDVARITGLSAQKQLHEQNQRSTGCTNGFLRISVLKSAGSPLPSKGWLV